MAAIDASGRFAGVARYAAYPDDLSTAEVAMEVVDEWQRHGVGTLLTKRVVARARSNGFDRLRATTMWENAPARALLRRLGFRASGTIDSLLDLELALLPE